MGTCKVRARNEPSEALQLIFDHGCQDRSMGKKSFQRAAPGHLDFHVRKSEVSCPCIRVPATSRDHSPRRPKG